MKLALIVSFLSILIVPTVRGAETNKSATDLERITSEYADVLALEGLPNRKFLRLHAFFARSQGWQLTGRWRQENFA